MKAKLKDCQRANPDGLGAYHDPIKLSAGQETWKDMFAWIQHPRSHISL